MSTPTNLSNFRLNLLSLFKGERKLNYSVDAHYKQTMPAGTSNKDKPARMPRALKHINMQEFQSFPQRRLELQEIEYNAYRKANEITATLREQALPDMTPEASEAEREAEQKKIDEPEPLTGEEMAGKEGLISQGSRTSKGLPAVCPCARNLRMVCGSVSGSLLSINYVAISMTDEIVDKTSADVAEYCPVFQEK